MGDFEVSLSFSIKAADRFDAARRIFRMIEAATPRTFWVCNEGGVGDEVRVPDEETGGIGAVADRPQDNPSDLAEDLYRLGVQFGAGSLETSEAEHKEVVADIKKRLLAALGA